MDASITSAVSIVSRVRGTGGADHPSKSGPATEGAKTSTVPQLIALAEELAAQGPPTDYARIAQVRAAIASGTYEINFAAIASAMLAPQIVSGDDA